MNNSEKSERESEKLSIKENMKYSCRTRVVGWLERLI